MKAYKHAGAGQLENVGNDLCNIKLTRLTTILKIKSLVHLFLSKLFVISQKEHLSKIENNKKQHSLFEIIQSNSK